MKTSKEKQIDLICWIAIGMAVIWFSYKIIGGVVQHFHMIIA